MRKTQRAQVGKCWSLELGGLRAWELGAWGLGSLELGAWGLELEAIDMPLSRSIIPKSALARTTIGRRSDPLGKKTVLRKTCSAHPRDHIGSTAFRRYRVWYVDSKAAMCV